MLTCQHAIRVKVFCCVLLLRSLLVQMCTYLSISRCSPLRSLSLALLTVVFLCSELPFSALEASCNFEEDLCNFYQDKDGPGWTRVKVKPNMYRPGDHTSGLGKSGICPCGTLGEERELVFVLHYLSLLYTYQMPT